MANPFDLQADQSFSGQGPQPSPQGQGASPQQGPQDSLEEIGADYDKLKAGQAMLGKVRTGLDSLVNMGDAVTQDDVIKVAGKLVAGGMTAEGMASLLSDMPEGGQQLQLWLSKHDQDVTQRSQVLNSALDAVRHHMGVLAMQKLGIADMAGQTAGAAPQGQNGPAVSMPSAGSANEMGF